MKTEKEIQDYYAALLKLQRETQDAGKEELPFNRGQIMILRWVLE